MASATPSFPARTLRTYMQPPADPHRCICCRAHGISASTGSFALRRTPESSTSFAITWADFPIIRSMEFNLLARISCIVGARFIAPESVASNAGVINHAPTDQASVGGRASGVGLIAAGLLLVSFCALSAPAAQAPQSKPLSTPQRSPQPAVPRPATPPAKQATPKLPL